MNLKGKQVIVVEDIVDTGNTMRKLMNVLAKYEPAVVKGRCIHRGVHQKEKFLKESLNRIVTIANV